MSVWKSGEEGELRTKLESFELTEAQLREAMENLTEAVQKLEISEVSIPGNVITLR